MVLIDLQLLNVQQAIISAIGTVVFSYVYYKRCELLYWFLSFLTLSVALIFNVFSCDAESIFLITNIFRAISMFFMFLAVFKDYYQEYLKGKRNSSNLKKVYYASIVVTPALIGFIAVLLVFQVLTSILSFLVFMKKRTPTYAFFTITTIVSH